MDKTELTLGLVYCQFLSCAEKEFLWEKLDNIQELALLSIEDIGYLIGRRMRSDCVWAPATLKDRIQHDLEIMNKFGIHFVSIISSEYPPQLREIYDPPFCLFWRGQLPDPRKPLVGMVGTRSPTGDSVLAALRLGREFAEAGISVVSGLAYGIDAFAHKGNTEGGGASVGVLACGVEQIYPRSNCRLAAKMLDCGGCLLSEYSPGSKPLQFRFPQRNRIISGLSRSVIVIEAPEKSGALITADFALEQGRDLYVYGGALSSVRGKGIQLLYEQGAPAISKAAEVLELWNSPLIQGEKKQQKKNTGSFSAYAAAGTEMQQMLDF
ncbi:DNA-processing protein DprA [Brucepastera parasyntrophica]|uniref:DNA-processing protein DprA n=1 Tax=Brucepastera parasyntrophica TaxID=2880008 RepID=UPI00210E7BFC|nr:DNA-processing protein DprA [Brucepastera parasyntrophica]ULQ60165.1 DNA-processing protein DprA [Brucepastera parasyntrophica]